MGEEKINATQAAAANFWYHRNISFNVANSPYWNAMVAVFKAVGRGMKLPTLKDLSDHLFEDVVVNTHTIRRAKEGVAQKWMQNFI